jgi:hypothetical protein
MLAEKTAGTVADTGGERNNPTPSRMPQDARDISTGRHLFWRWARRLAFVALIAGWLPCGGCAESAIAAAGATAGFGLAQGQAESFIRGELKAARLVPLVEAHEAVHKALAEMQLMPYRDRIDQYDAAVGARAKGGRDIKIYLKADSPVMTRITVRVGLLGDSAVSTLIMQRIDRALAGRLVDRSTADLDDAEASP